MSTHDTNLRPGIRVGCTYRDSPPHQPWIHPDHRGTVLAQDDPRAWAKSMAFPFQVPTRHQVRAHLANLAKQGIPVQDTPVLWDFGSVFWESSEALYPARSGVAKAA